MRPLVSVVLPFRNAEATLDRAINSIVQQAFLDWELILVNHASDDQSAEVARRWCRKDQRLRLISDNGVGLVSALNAGLGQVNAPYVARMDADDFSYPDRLMQQYNFLSQHPNVGGVGCQVRYCSSAPPQPGMQAYVTWVNQLVGAEEIWLNQFVESPLVHPSVMFRTQLLRQYGVYRSGDFPEDYELWLRWLGKGVVLAKLPSTLLDWYDAPARLSRTSQRYHPDAFYRIKTNYLAHWLQQHNPFFPDVVVWGGGRKSRQRVRWLEAHGIRIRAIIDVVPNKTSTYPCIFYQDITPPGQYFILSYVGNRGQRDSIRHFLRQRGYVEGKHFLMVA